MFYFIHATSLNNFEKILKTGFIYASFFLPSQKTLLSGPVLSKYVFTNIYTDDLPLTKEEYAGIGEVTLIIDPIILKYKKCYFNIGWNGSVDDTTIIMNDNIDYVLDIVHSHYQYPFVITHEALFKKRININFVIGVISNKNNQRLIKKLFKKYGFCTIKYFTRLGFTRQG